MAPITPEELEALIRECLDDFYKRRINRLSTLQLKETLRKKNPYLLRAIGIELASDLIAHILQAYMSSSDETIFGDRFFEPIARKVSGGRVASHEGIDVIIETDTVYTPISVKSSPNAFNSSQAKRMDDEFRQLRNRMQKIHKKYDPLLGHCYGRVNTEPSKFLYRRRSGQLFWEELTGDPDFYLKLMRIMGEIPKEHAITYKTEYSNAINRFTKDFLLEFSNDNGGIDWDKLLIYNSGKPSKYEEVKNE